MIPERLRVGLALEYNREKSSTHPTPPPPRPPRPLGAGRAQLWVGDLSVCLGRPLPASGPPPVRPSHTLSAPSPPHHPSAASHQRRLTGLLLLPRYFLFFSLQVPVSPVARISQVSFPSSRVWGLLWLLCVSSTFLSLLPPFFFEFFSLSSFLSSPLPPSPRLFPSPSFFSPPCLLHFCCPHPHQPCDLLSTSLASGLNLTSFWVPLLSPPLPSHLCLFLCVFSRHSALSPYFVIAPSTCSVLGRCCHQVSHGDWRQ